MVGYHSRGYWSYAAKDAKSCPGATCSAGVVGHTLDGSLKRCGDIRLSPQSCARCLFDDHPQDFVSQYIASNRVFPPTADIPRSSAARFHSFVII